MSFSHSRGAGGKNKSAERSLKRQVRESKQSCFSLSTYWVQILPDDGYSFRFHPEVKASEL